MSRGPRVRAHFFPKHSSQHGINSLAVAVPSPCLTRQRPEPGTARECPQLTDQRANARLITLSACRAFTRQVRPRRLPTAACWTPFYGGQPEQQAGTDSLSVPPFVGEDGRIQSAVTSGAHDANLKFPAAAEVTPSLKFKGSDERSTVLIPSPVEGTTRARPPSQPAAGCCVRSRLDRGGHCRVMKDQDRCRPLTRLSVDHLAIPLPGLAHGSICLSLQHVPISALNCPVGRAFSSSYHDTAQYSSSTACETCRRRGPTSSSQGRWPIAAM